MVIAYKAAPWDQVITDEISDIIIVTRRISLFKSYESSVKYRSLFTIKWHFRKKLEIWVYKEGSYITEDGTADTGSMTGAFYTSLNSNGSAW